MDIQTLINTGQAWMLEGFVGRQCMDAIESGIAILGPIDHRDYWGNHIPSRYQVKAGTKGSVQYANAIRKRYGYRPLRGVDFDKGMGYDMYEYEGY